MIWIAIFRNQFISYGKVNNYEHRFRLPVIFLPDAAIDECRTKLQKQFWVNTVAITALAGADNMVAVDFTLDVKSVSAVGRQMRQTHTHQKSFFVRIVWSGRVIFLPSHQCFLGVEVSIWSSTIKSRLLFEWAMVTIDFANIDALI